MRNKLNEKFAENIATAFEMQTMLVYVHVPGYWTLYKKEKLGIEENFYISPETLLQFNERENALLCLYSHDRLHSELGTVYIYLLNYFPSHIISL